MPPIEASPRSMSIDDFARKAESVKASLEYGRPRPRVVTQLLRSYRNIDGLTTVDMSVPDTGKFVVGLRATANACEASLSKKRAFSLKGHDDTRALLGDILIEKASSSLQLPEYDYHELTKDMDRANELFMQSKGMRSAKKGYDPHKYGHEKISNLFGHFSVRALQVHLDARELQANGNFFAEGILRSRIGGLALDAIGHMRIMGQEYIERPDDSLRGRFVETAAYAYKTMEWQDAPQVADHFVRFAVEREDHPTTENRPRRSFDLVEANKGAYTPLQVKAGGRGGGAYHHRITKLQLNHGDMIAQDPIGFTELFEQAFDSDASTAKRAYSELSDYFVERQYPIEEPVIERDISIAK